MHPVLRPERLHHKVRKVLGIDLGTTNSVIALLDPTDTAILTGCDEQGRKTFPSLINYSPEKIRVVAGREAATQPGRALPLASVKRYMGLEHSFAVGPETLNPAQASAHVLRHLRDVMARSLGDAKMLLDAAIVTMPAYFNHNQIEATRQAGELAGFEVVELLHEPTAAAIYYSWLEGHTAATYLVYDLGGGTFDVSVIRKRYEDYEVLSVSGDPFLGGDDFDRLLAVYLAEHGTWKPRRPSLDPHDPVGKANLAQLVRVAESMKAELSDKERAERFLPGLFRDEAGGEVSLEVSADRAAFERLIKDKVDRTIDCCHEALARAKDRAGLRLEDIDHVILVGGSSRVPLVRQTVRAAFANPALPQRVKNPDPLLHEPDLCVAYGAALRAATHGTRYLFSPPDAPPALELRLTSPNNTRDTRHTVTGLVRVLCDAPVEMEGASVRVRNIATGLIEESFLDPRGSFAQEVELHPETDNVFEYTICDADGSDLARVSVPVRHQSEARHLGQAVLPTQLITKPLQIEVLSRARQRSKQVVAPIGATLPNAFRTTCRTQDQAGRVVVPIYEENRIVKQMVISDLDPDLPVGSPVDVELAIDVKHNITVKVRVAQKTGDRTETAVIEAAPPPSRPTRADVEAVMREIDALLAQFAGSFRSRMRSRAQRLQGDLHEALNFDDEPKAIQRMAELRELLQNLEASQGQQLEPPWPKFSQLVRYCLDLASRVAEATGRDRQELFEHVHAQERYAEQAFEEHNQALYRECGANLRKYSDYLEGLLREDLPRPPVAEPPRPPEEAAKDALERFRGYLANVWKQVRAKNRDDLEARLKTIANQAGGLNARLKTEPVDVLRDTRRLETEVAKVHEALTGPRKQTGGEEAGLLEGPA